MISTSSFATTTALACIPNNDREREQRKREVATLTDKVNSLHLKLISDERLLEEHQKEVTRLVREIRTGKRELKINSKALSRAVKR